jgi:hypothetical protein
MATVVLFYSSIFHLFTSCFLLDFPFFISSRSRDDMIRYEHVHCSINFSHSVVISTKQGVWKLRVEAAGSHSGNQNKSIISTNLHTPS